MTDIIVLASSCFFNNPVILSDEIARIKSYLVEKNMKNVPVAV